MPGLAASRELTIYMAPTPGLADRTEDAQVLQGPVPDLLRRILRDAGLEPRFVIASQSRALKDVPLQSSRCVPLVRTAAIEGQYRWIGPLARMRMVVFGRADEAADIRTHEDLRGRKLGAVRDSQPARWLEDQGIAHTAVADHITALRMLQAQRFDLWVANEMLASQLARAQGGQQPKVLHFISNLEMYLACHPQLEVEQVEAMNAATQRLRSAGAMKFLGLP